MKAIRSALLVTAAVLAPVTAVMADDKVLYVAGPGGSMEKALRDTVFPAFTAETGMTVEYVAGNSTDTLAKLQAQAGNQKIDIAMIDDGPMAQAVGLGFCKDLQIGALKNDLYDIALFPDGKSLAYGLLGSGIMYNAKVFEEKGWAAPSSLKDLSDPKFAGTIIIPPLNNTYGVLTLVQVAKMNGGSESDIDPGFAAFADGISENVLAFEPSPGKMTELFQSGQALMAIWGSSRAKAFADEGFPAKFVYPSEGGAVIGAGICAVAGGAEKPQADAFITKILQPDMQVAIAKTAGLAPVNKNAEVPAEFQAGMPYGEAEIKKLVTVDWVTINQHRADWNARWTREVER